MPRAVYRVSIEAQVIELDIDRKHETHLADYECLSKLVSFLTGREEPT